MEITQYSITETELSSHPPRSSRDVFNMAAVSGVSCALHILGSECPADRNGRRRTIGERMVMETRDNTANELDEQNQSFVSHRGGLGWT
jgi:hypothetical protein